MATKKNKTSKIGRLKSLMREHRRSFIIWIPEERDDSPHWLFWLLIVLVVVFLLSWLLLRWDGSAALLSYLSYK